MRRWSKLQHTLYSLVAPDIPFQMHCVAYPMDSQWSGTDLPRYWIKFEKAIIWDYPKQFISLPAFKYTFRNYPYITEISEISNLIREYIDTPQAELLRRRFDSDRWGLINILRAADRRIGQRRLQELQRKTHNQAALQIVQYRLQHRPEPRSASHRDNE